ncbi:MAG: GGDEF domain-containing protein [Gammaproteobacteria bacterium]
MLNESQLEKHYWYLYRFGVLTAMLVHACFISLFKYLDATPLALGNVGSVIVYGLCLKLLSDKRYLSVITLSSVEIIAHSIAAVSVLGWTSGFQYYLLMFIPIIFVSAKRANWVKVLTMVMIYVLYGGMFIYTSKMPPLASLGQNDLYIIHLLNMGVCFSFLALVAHFYIQLVQKSEIKLQTLASTDTLTGLLNRRKLIEVIEYEKEQGERTNAPYSMVMVDIDDFKKINDTYGHEAGDYVLKTTSYLLGQVIRKQDSAARWGGEEFLLLCPDTNIDAATRVANRILNQVNSFAFEFEGMSFSVTLSIGVAESTHKEFPADCIARADEALYKAKHTGKNRVCVSKPLKQKPRLRLVPNVAE